MQIPSINLTFRGTNEQLWNYKQPEIRPNLNELVYVELGYRSKSEIDWLQQVRVINIRRIT